MSLLPDEISFFYDLEPEFHNCLNRRCLQRVKGSWVHLLSSFPRNTKASAIARIESRIFFGRDGHSSLKRTKVCSESLALYSPGGRTFCCVSLHAGAVCEGVTSDGEEESILLLVLVFASWCMLLHEEVAGGRCWT